jgi:hypothetical protein
LRATRGNYGVFCEKLGARYLLCLNFPFLILFSAFAHRRNLSPNGYRLISYRLRSGFKFI